MKLYDRIFPPKKIILPNGKMVFKPRTRVPLVLTLFAVAIYLSVEMTRIDLEVLSRNWLKFFDILAAMSKPNWATANRVWNPLFETIKMSLLGSIIGCTAALPFAVAASTNIVKAKWATITIRVLGSVLRTLPTLVIALLATFIFESRPFAGMVAIAIFTFSIVMKMLYEQIETVDMGAFEAVEALGGTKLRSFMSSVLPQVLPFYLSSCIYCFEINVRHASILGYVGAGGIGMLTKQIIGWQDYDQLGTLLIMLYGTVFILENVSKALRRRLA